MLSDMKKIFLKIRGPVFLDKGFTIIELMVALTILAIAMIGIESIMLSIVRTRVAARKVSIATDLCQTKIEEMRSLGYNAVVNCLESNIDEKGCSGGAFNRTVTVSTGPVAKSKVVLVNVRWNGMAGTRAVSLRTIVADI